MPATTAALQQYLGPQTNGADVDHQRRYVYMPIAEKGEIRVLHIDKAFHTGDPPSCYVSTVKLRDIGTRGEIPEPAAREKDIFVALSYCCGVTSSDGSHLTHTILCDGAEVKVTANLHFALIQLQRRVDNDALGLLFDREDAEADTPSVAGRALRVPRQTQRPAFWIDALCINQADVRERSCQVAQMAQVYACAHSAFIWLGENLKDADDHVHPGDILQYLQKPAHFRQAWRGREDDFIRLWDRNPCSMRPNSDRHWHWEQARQSTLKKVAGPRESEAIMKLVNLPWFSRRWVIQECLFSRTQYFLLGNIMFDTNQLKKAADMFDFKNTVLQNLRSRKYVQRSSFLRVMHSFDNQKCAEDSDRVYALASISNDVDVTVDYALNTEQVYTAVAVAFCNRGQAAAVLVSTSCRKRADGESDCLPSWVPDWRIHMQFSSAVHSTAIDRILFRNLTSSRGNDNKSYVRDEKLMLRCRTVSFCLESPNCEPGTCRYCDLFQIFENPCLSKRRTAERMRADIRRPPDDLSRGFDSSRSKKRYLQEVKRESHGCMTPRIRGCALEEIGQPILPINIAEEASKETFTSP